VQKCQQEVEEPGIASQHHKNPPLTHCCVRGRWRSTGAHDGAYTLASHGRRPSPRLRVRWQGPRSAVCTGVGAVRPGQKEKAVAQPCSAVPCRATAQGSRASTVMFSASTVPFRASTVHDLPCCMGFSESTVHFLAWPVVGHE
jgi:hypothetical protein